LISKTNNNSNDDTTSAMTKTTTSSSTSTTDNNGSSSFHIESCAPQGLVDALMCSRGKEETIKILRESYELVASSSSSSSSSLLVSPNDKNIAATDDNNNNDDDDEKLLGEALLSEPIETSILSPRLGKFSLQLYKNGLMATKMNDPTIKITLLANNNTSSPSSSTPVVVSHALLFPKPEDCKVIVSNRKDGAKQKKTGGNLVLLRLSSAISVPKHKSPTRQLCFALPADTKLGRPIGPSLLVQSSSSSSSSSDTTSDDNDNDNNKQPTEEWGKVLKQALGGRQQGTEEEQKESLVLAIIRPGIDFKSHQPNKSSSTTAGMPFVNCYLGVNDGVLYPLKEGLLFYKPPRFLPRSDLHSIACGRGGGDSSRYVDMVVQCNSSENDHNNNSNEKEEEEEQQETVEFTNINREENIVLNSYIHDVLVPAMTDDAHRASATTKEAKESSTEKNSNSDDDDDDDSAEVVAIAEVDAADDDDDEYEKIELVQGEETESDDDDDDEDFEGEDDDEVSDDDDDDDDSENDDEGVAVVPDDLAQELVKEKRRKQKEDSATESEDEGDGPRLSKRLRRGA
jgi:hypothetical protein